MFFGIERFLLILILLHVVSINLQKFDMFRFHMNIIIIYLFKVHLGTYID